MRTQTPKYARQPTYILCLNTSFAISSHRDSASIILYIWLVTAVVFVSVFKHCWLMAGSRKNSSGARKSHGIFCNQESGNPVGTDKALCFRPVHQSVCVCVFPGGDIHSLACCRLPVCRCGSRILHSGCLHLCLQCFYAVGWATGRASSLKKTERVCVCVCVCVVLACCLSGARCRLAYAPVDATATHCLFLQ